MPHIQWLFCDVLIDRTVQSENIGDSIPELICHNYEDRQRIAIRNQCWWFQRQYIIVSPVLSANFWRKLYYYSNEQRLVIIFANLIASMASSKSLNVVHFMRSACDYFQIITVHTYTHSCSWRVRSFWPNITLSNSSADLISLVNDPNGDHLVAYLCCV